jgi:hypothetical protein
LQGAQQLLQVELRFRFRLARPDRSGTSANSLLGFHLKLRSVGARKGLGRITLVSCSAGAILRDWNIFAARDFAAFVGIIYKTLAEQGSGASRWRQATGTRQAVGKKFKRCGSFTDTKRLSRFARSGRGPPNYGMLAMVMNVDRTPLPEGATAPF